MLFRRKQKKDLCGSCRWYYPENGTCQIKKCAGRGGPGYVTRWDRKHCKGYEPKPLATVTKIKEEEQGISISAELTPEGKKELEKMGIDLAAGEDKSVFWADNKRYEMTPMQMMTPNELREANGFKRKFLGEPYCTPDDELLKHGDIRCEYCGRINSKRHRICDGCGAPL